MERKVAKKSTKSVQTIFEVRFKGRGISPETVPLRTVSDALSAIQDLASGRDPYETHQVPAEKSIGLVKVRRGSAVYAFVSKAPDEALSNLKRTSALLEDDDSYLDDDFVVAAFRPIESLSEIARSIGCSVEVGITGRADRPPIFTVEGDDYPKIASRLFLKGETTIVGTVQRVGGATDTRCALRVEGRRKLLYCKVSRKEIARKLGLHLYERIAATGTATWLHRSWRVHDFTISDFTQPEMNDVSEALEGLRKAGLDAWDKVKDPEKLIKSMR